jgi:hypothetical protein
MIAGELANADQHIGARSTIGGTRKPSIRASGLRARTRSSMAAASRARPRRWPDQGPRRRHRARARGRRADLERHGEAQHGGGRCRRLGHVGAARRSERHKPPAPLSPPLPRAIAGRPRRPRGWCAERRLKSVRAGRRGLQKQLLMAAVKDAVREAADGVCRPVVAGDVRRLEQPARGLGQVRASQAVSTFRLVSCPFRRPSATTAMTAGVASPGSASAVGQLRTTASTPGSARTSVSAWV